MEKAKINDIFTKILQSKVLLGFVVFLFVLKVVTVIIPINFSYNIFFADITKSSLENFANQTRQSLGLQPLAESEKLNQAAKLKAENMVQNQYFDHTSPTGITPWFWFKQAGYNYKYAGENLAVGFFESEEVFNAWLNSPSHKANIVNPKYTEVGTAILNGFGSGNAIVVVQEFGTQLPVKQVATQPKTQVKPPVTQPAQPPEVVKPETPITDTGSGAGERVLSQETEFKSFLGVPAGNAQDNLVSRSLNFVIYDYDRLLQNVIYGVVLIIMGILIALILFNFKIPLKRELVFRALLIVILLSLATALNKELIISIIPHQVII
jgi:hypothetical protein